MEVGVVFNPHVTLVRRQRTHIEFVIHKSNCTSMPYISCIIAIGLKLTLQLVIENKVIKENNELYYFCLAIL